MNYKKILLGVGSLGAVLAPITGVMSCGSTTTGVNPKKDIAMIVSTRNNPYFVSLIKGASDEAKKDGYKLRVFVSNNDQKTESDKVDEIITLGYKTLILNGLDAAQSGVAAKKAIDAGLKVIAVDRKLSGVSVFTTIASANEDGAKRLAAAVLKISGIVGGKMLHLQGISGEANGIQRWRGVNAAKTAAHFSGALEELRADYNRAKGQAKTSTAKTAHTDIKWVSADNDEMALGAIAAYGTAAGQSVKITGFDGTPDAMAAVKAGTLFGTVKQDTHTMGKKAVMAAIDALGGHDYPDIVMGHDITVPVLVITSANIDNPSDQHEFPTT